MQFETIEDHKEFQQVRKLFPDLQTKMTPSEKRTKHHFTRECAVIQATPQGALSGVLARTRRIHQRGLTVDHIVPLWGRNAKGDHIVCGLNVAWNLRGEKAHDNLVKGSHFTDSPDAIAIILPKKVAIA